MQSLLYQDELGVKKIAIDTSALTGVSGNDDGNLEISRLSDAK